MSFCKAAPVVAVLLLSLLSQLTSAAQRPPSSRWVEFKPGGVMGVAGGYALIYGIANMSKQPLCAMVEFNSPAGDRQCEFIERIEPGASSLFSCPFTTIQPGERYPMRLSVYTDDRLAERVARFEPVFRAHERELAEFNKLRADRTDLPSMPVSASDDGAASPELPTSFEPTWFRRLQRGFSLRAYEDSGQLTVNADALVFTAEGKTLRIPVSQVTSVRFDGMPRDLANDWVVVRFINDEQKPDGVGFKDGTGLGREKARA